MSEQTSEIIITLVQCMYTTQTVQTTTSKKKYLEYVRKRKNSLPVPSQSNTSNTVPMYADCLIPQIPSQSNNTSRYMVTRKYDYGEGSQKKQLSIRGENQKFWERAPNAP